MRRSFSLVLATATVLGGLSLTPAFTAANAATAHAATAHAAARPAARAASHGQTLRAEIRRTTDGIPHILAKNWTDLGFGYGFAFAQDNICTMANDYITVEAQRSKYFGPNGIYVSRGSGAEANNLDSDLFYQQIINSHVIARLTKGFNPALRQIQAGYVAGYNKYLASVGGAKGVPDPTCRGKAWVKPITEQDSFLRFYQLMLMSSSSSLISSISEAQPPGAKANASASASASAKAANSRAALVLTDPRQAARKMIANYRAEHAAMGSNAVAIGSQGTRNHHGLLLGNPHFPWIGTERFYQAQLTIPGKINVTGASLYGVPAVLIGHNANVAWSHTVSTAFRFTPYQLKIVKGHPTEYLQDGHPVKMVARKVTVMARQTGGKLAAVSRTLYSTRYGPMVNNLFGISLPWTQTSAFTMRDANATNLARAMNTWFGIDRATSTQQVLSTIRKFQGIPWVNTIASDRHGTALYADIGSIPGVPNSLAHKCDTGLGALTFAEAGLPILDGSKTSCDWITGPHAAAPGLMGPGQEPFVLRKDYVTNSNDSYWLANPHHPLTGFARIIGDEKTPRTLRTRIGLIEVQARIDGTDGLGPRGFTLSAMQHLDLNDLDYAGVLTRNALVTMCRNFSKHNHGFAPTSHGGKVKLGNACTVLAHWNLRWDPSQRGAVLFGAFWSLVNGSPAPFAQPFKVSDPVHTPFQLNTANKAARNALGNAITELNNAHVPLDASLASVQFVTDHGKHIAIPGGPGDPDGIYNAIYRGDVSGDSLTAPDDGSSFIQVVTWNNTSCPVGATILTYSESSNPASPHFADQTKLFSHKKWLKDRFCESQIRSDPHLKTLVVVWTPAK
jgi:acyl-homoserine-lactone acylase